MVLKSDPITLAYKVSHRLSKASVNKSSVEKRQILLRLLERAIDLLQEGADADHKTVENMRNSDVYQEAKSELLEAIAEYEKTAAEMKSACAKLAKEPAVQNELDMAYPLFTVPARKLFRLCWER